MKSPEDGSRYLVLAGGRDEDRKRRRPGPSYFLEDVLFRILEPGRIISLTR